MPGVRPPLLEVGRKLDAYEPPRNEEPARPELLRSRKQMEPPMKPLALAALALAGCAAPGYAHTVFPDNYSVEVDHSCSTLQLGAIVMAAKAWEDVVPVSITVTSVDECSGVGTCVSIYSPIDLPCPEAWNMPTCDVPGCHPLACHYPDTSAIAVSFELNIGDFLTVMIHELGHMQQLGHTGPGTVMYFEHDSFQAPAPTAGDIQQWWSLHGPSH